MHACMRIITIIIIVIVMCVYNVKCIYIMHNIIVTFIVAMGAYTWEVVRPGYIHYVRINCMHIWSYQLNMIIIFEQKN